MNNLDDNMSLDAAVPRTSDYLGKDDVSQPITATIMSVGRASIKTDDGGEERKTVLNFQESNLKPLILNQTNKELLKALFGATTVGDLRGLSIGIWNDPTVMFGGRAVGGLRIQKPAGAAPMTREESLQQPDPATHAGDPGQNTQPPSGFDDTVPF